MVQAGGSEGAPTATGVAATSTTLYVTGYFTWTDSFNAQNQYTSVSARTTPTYDNNGNMTKDSAGLEYIYDAWNRLVKVENSAGTTTLETFEYDGLGRRIAITVSGTTTNLYYSNQDQVLEEHVGSDYTKRYVWSPVYVNALLVYDSLVSVGPTGRFWALHDANWNTIALVNSSGSIVERYDYTPFGKLTIYDGSGTVLSGSYYGMVYLYQGMRLDPVTGDDEADNRLYDPVMQCWTTQDPEELAAGDPNMARFVGNRPTNATDPSGLFPAPEPRPLKTTNDDIKAAVSNLEKLRIETAKELKKQQAELDDASFRIQSCLNDGGPAIPRDVSRQNEARKNITRLTGILNGIDQSTGVLLDLIRQDPNADNTAARQGLQALDKYFQERESDDIEAIGLGDGGEYRVKEVQQLGEGHRIAIQAALGAIPAR